MSVYLSLETIEDVLTAAATSRQMTACPAQQGIHKNKEHIRPSPPLEFWQFAKTCWYNYNYIVYVPALPAPPWLFIFPLTNETCLWERVWKKAVYICLRAFCDDIYKVWHFSLSLSLETERVCFPLFSVIESSVTVDSQAKPSEVELPSMNCCTAKKEVMTDP